MPTIQDDMGLHFPVDDITEPMTTCELHIPQGTATVMVAVGVVTHVDPTKTPRIHGANMLVSRWIELSNASVMCSLR